MKLEGGKYLETSNDKQKYIDSLTPGMLIAFNTPNDGIKSGKVEDVYTFHVTVEEYSGERVIVYKKDIAWVKTGKRWPKEIFNELIGKTAEEENGDETNPC